MVPLGEGCFVIAESLGHPTAPDEGIAALDALASSTSAAVESHGDALDLGAIGRHLFGDAGVQRRPRALLRPRNSMLARRPAAPVRDPHHARHRRRSRWPSASASPPRASACPATSWWATGRVPSRWVDGFDGGRVARRRRRPRRASHAIHGAAATFDRSFLAPTPRPADPGPGPGQPGRDLPLARRSDPLLRALELRCDIPGVGMAPRAQVELAEAYVAVGRVGDAVDLLELLRERVDPRRKDVLAERIQVLRAGLN